MAGHEEIGALVHQTLLGDAWEHAHVAVAVLAEDRRYLACNRAFCDLTGYSRDEIGRLRVAVDLAADRKKAARLFREVLGGKRVVGAASLLRKDGGAVEINFWAIETRAANLPYTLVLYWPSSDRPKRSKVA